MRHGPFVPPTTCHDATGEWWACTQPERPVDPDYTAFHVDCAACLVALQVAAIHHPDTGLDVRDDRCWDDVVIYGRDVQALIG